jgi:hypothetical protein
MIKDSCFLINQLLPPYPPPRGRKVSSLLVCMGDSWFREETSLRALPSSKWKVGGQKLVSIRNGSRHL